MKRLIFSMSFALGLLCFQAGSAAAGNFDPASLPKTLKWSEVKGVPFVYSDQGSGDPLVILTPYPFGVGLWSGLVERLKGEYRVVVVEPPGVRDPSSMEEDFSTEHLLQLYRQFLRDLGMHKAHLLGLGETGGMVMAFGHHYPENTGSVISINGFETVGWNPAFEATIELIRQGAGPGMKNLMMMGSSRFMKKPPSEDELGAMVPEQGDLVKQATEERLNDFVSDIKVGYILMMMPNHNRPTLLIRSEKDGVLTEDFTPRSRRVIRKATLRLKKFPEAGHFAFLDEPDEVAASITTFLTEHPLKKLN
ncbi:MAG TPA: alpha/beta hydrolase [Nitrospiria bacterium]|nr:alpha/beta hydrolase [Nitrospiria bacterium]